MKEFAVTLSEDLMQGLAPDPGLAPGQFAGRLHNLYPGQYALQTPPAIYDLAGGDTLEWPFPQVFAGWTRTLLCGSDAIFHLDGNELTELISYDWYSPGSLKAITEGATWQAADFGVTHLLTNGSCMVIQSPKSPKLLIQDAVPVQSCCNLRNGRLVLGGFDPESLQGHRELLETYESHAPGEVRTAIHGAENAGENWVWWSSIGGGDAFSLWHFNPDYLSLIRRNQSGWAPMPWRGTVKSIIETADGCIVYGDHGITELRAYTEPVATLAPAPIRGLKAGTGILHRGAAAGDEFSHLFVSQDHELWQISGGEAKRLGYREQIQELGDDIMLSMDSAHHCIWIASSKAAYVLGPRGLGGPMDMRPTSLGYHDGKLVGAGVAISRHEFPWAVESRVYDFGDRGTKKITTVQTDAQCSRPITASVSDGANGISCPDALMNPNGAAFPRFSCVTPVIKLKGAAGRNDPVVLTRIEVRYNAEDLRFRRGAKSVARGFTQEEAT